MRLTALTTLVLAALSLGAGVVSHLALTDIQHGYELDLSQEWATLRFAAFVAAVFHVWTVVTAVRLLRRRD